MSVDRYGRIAEEIKRELGQIILNDLKDPRMPGMVSVMAVKVARDLRYAKVFISVFGNEEEKQNALIALKNAAGFIRREVGHRMMLRYTPEFVFELDTSIEQGAYISKLINDMNKEKQ